MKEGDGHPLKPYRFWHIFSRSVFYLKLGNKDAESAEYAVEFNYWAEDSTAELYLNGKHTASSKLPAAFPVQDGIVEASVGSYGISRIHYVKNKHSYPLQPDKHSLRGLRLGLHKHFPKTSKWIERISATILLVALFLSLPQLIELLSQIPWVSEHIGQFESPIQLPATVNTTLLIGGFIAGVERTLMLRSHWLIDMETNYWDH
ncbi:hypothetical protein [Alkalihalobacillus pseudalcaliphilus]|uniref:hypothetical protein n=1 Tax=Alkalihalobacillus pseudalcaliphilus TaxID=79884 RepID=UPI00069E47BD|nr:hypothetical protein [Alkalihalobacillus pseudalcaliphilus]